MSQITNLELSASGSGAVMDLTGNTGGPVSPDIDGNINVLGDGTIVITTGDPGTNTLTISLENGLDGQLLIGSTAGSLAFATLASADSSVTITNGSNSIDLSVDAAASGAVIDFLPDSGTSPVVPDGAGSVTITGGTTGFTFVGGANTLTLTGSPSVMTVTALTDSDSPYTVLSTDHYMTCDVSGGVLTIALPNAPATGRVYIVKDAGGDAADFNITVTTAGGVVEIDGATTFVMNTAYQAANFLFNGSSWEVF